MFINTPDQQRALSIAHSLLISEAVRLSIDQPFRWASGWNSPIYCDNRVTLSYPSHRQAIKEGLASFCQVYFPEAEGLAGVATAGIPQAALVSDALQLPMCYVRPKPKDHGMQNLIEGRIHPGQKVVVIEDLVSTGGSSLKAVESLRDAGVQVLGMLAVFTYGFQQAEDAFAKADLPLYCLSDYTHLLQTALSMGIFKEDQLTVLESWRKDPAHWKA